MNHNLAEYHVAVNKDINDIEVIFVEEKDDVINPLGIKGLGEIGIVGVAGAVANGCFPCYRKARPPITDYAG